VTTFVTGIGLCTPLGRTPRQNVAFYRAGLGTNPRASFAEGEAPLPVNVCPWLGSKLPVANRLIDLGKVAIAHALADRPRQTLRLVLCFAGVRPDLEDDAIKSAAETLGLGFSTTEVRRGDTQYFGVLAGALSGPVEATLVVSLDTYISEASLEDAATEGKNAWRLDLPAKSEGAAAVLLESSVKPGTAPLATLLSSATAVGLGSDDDDESTDGAALTSLLEQLPAAAPIVMSYGQEGIDSLRRLDFTYASCRTSTRFHAAFERECLESTAGRLGAAAPGANMAFALAFESARQRVAARESLPPGPILVWTLGHDGTRGVALLLPNPEAG
jgi:hypothetical protein